MPLTLFLSAFKTLAGMRPTGEEDGTNSSERSFQSFQEGELSGLGAQPDGSKGHPSNTVSPQLQIADQLPASGGRRQTGQNDEQVESTATQNESTSAHVPSQCSVDVGRSLVGVEDRDGASTEMKAGGSGEMDSMLKSGPTMVQRAVADATTCRQPAVDEQSNPGDPRKRISEAENQRRQVELEQETGSLPNTKPQPQAIAQGIVLKPPVDCKTHLGSQSTEDAPTHPSHEVPAEPRRVCTAVDEHGEDHSGSGGASAANNGADNADDEDEEDALLLPGASTSQGSQIEQGHGGAGHGSGFSLLKDSETTVLQTAVERAAEELLVDDIDDESTTLLERSPVTTARCPKSKPPLASTSTTTGAVAAEAEASAKDSPVLSSASSSAGGMAAKDTPSLPAATPPPASTAPTSTAVAAATNFNYYELPVVPEHAPEATGQRADRGTRSTDPSTGNIRQPTLSRTRPAEEHVSISSSLLVLPYRCLTYARRLLGFGGRYTRAVEHPPRPGQGRLFCLGTIGATLHGVASVGHTLSLIDWFVPSFTTLHAWVTKLPSPRLGVLSSLNFNEENARKASKTNFPAPCRQSSTRMPFCYSQLWTTKPAPLLV